MRRIGKKQTLKLVKQLDAFPKVQQDYQKPTTRGGVFSAVALTIILFLVISELFYYRNVETTYEYSVDTDLYSKLKIVFDITVKMPCEYLGADVIDAAGESKSSSQGIKREKATFELTREQRDWLRHKQSLMQQYRGYRSLDDLPTLGSQMSHDYMPKGNLGKSHQDSCRVFGHVDINKVAGNFHITAGQAIPHPQGHAHLNAFVPSHLLNFSHRIDRFAFGDMAPGIVNALDGTLHVTNDPHHMSQYYLKVVPTSFVSPFYTYRTNQYSVTEQNRSVNHMTGSHGLAGIFFKYDLNPLMVTITQKRRSFVMFLVRLCAIVGGVFATSGMISQFMGYIVTHLFARSHSSSATTT